MLNWDFQHPDLTGLNYHTISSLQWKSTGTDALNGFTRRETQRLHRTMATCWGLQTPKQSSIPELCPSCCPYKLYTGVLRQELPSVRSHFLHTRLAFSRAQKAFHVSAWPPGLLSSVRQTSPQSFLETFFHGTLETVGYTAQDTSETAHRPRLGCT